MDRRIVPLAALAILVISLVAVQSPAQAQGNTALTATIKAVSLNVRSGPSTSDSRVATLRARSAVTVLGRNSAGTWLEIQTNQSLVGWVFALWVSLPSGNVMALPVVSTTGAAQPPTVPTSGGVTATVITFQLNVRTAPGTTSGKVGMLQAKGVETVLGRNSAGTWLKIQTSQGLVGWVFAKLVTLSGASLMNLPVVS